MTARQVQWAHSVLNDPGQPEKVKRRAKAILAKHDPEGLLDHDNDLIRTRGRFSDE